MRDGYYEILKPALYFLSLKKPSADIDDKTLIDSRFDEARKVINSIDLQCEPSQYKNLRGGKYLPMGSYIEGSMHIRGYVCGYPGLADIGGFRVLQEQHIASITKLPVGKVPSEYDGGTYTSIAFARLQNSNGINALINPDSKLDEEDLPKVIYERVKDKLPSDWYAIFTVKSDDRQRHVIVAKDGVNFETVVPRPN